MRRATTSSDRASRDFRPVFGPPARFELGNEPERVLVQLPGWVGDVCMATPALRSLRMRFPSAHLAVLTRPHLGRLLDGSSLFDEFIPFRARGPRATWRAARQLRSRGFEASVLLAESERAALLARLAGIPIRAGLFHTWPRRVLLSHGIPRVRSATGELARFSMIERYLQVSRSLGAMDAGDQMELTVTPEARASVEARLGSAGVSAEEPLLFLSPGAAAQGKAWPAERFAAVARTVGETLHVRCVLAPGPGEEAMAREVATEAGAGTLVLGDPVLDLSELSALVARSTAVLTNDSGPRSIAVAHGRPVCVLVREDLAPYTEHHLDLQEVVCAKDLDGVPPGDVVPRVLSCLQQGARLDGPRRNQS